MSQMSLEELVSQLKAAYGPSLRSVVLYGSAAAGEHIAKRSDYNVLVIVDSIDASRLGAASATARAWTDGGNPAPLTLTTTEWRGSADIFPMEYADILERHKVLFGDAPFDGIQVDRRDLRLQLEQEAMGKLLRLRQGTLASGNDGARQVELLAASASQILVICRAFLRLQRAVPPKDNIALVQEVASLASFDGEPFKRVVRHVRGEDRIAPGEASRVLDGYMRGMEHLVGYLDRYEPAAAV